MKRSWVLSLVVVFASIGGASAQNELIGSWSFESTDPEFTFEEVITFFGTRFTVSVEFEEPLITEAKQVTTATTTGTYDTDTTVTPNRITFFFEPFQFGEAVKGEILESRAIYEVEGDVLRFGSSDTGDQFPPSFESAAFVSEFMRIGSRSVCNSLSSTIATQYTMLREAAGLGDDIDGDGLPEDAVLELARFVSCDGRKVPDRTNIAETVESAFLLNQATVRNAGAVDFAEAAALLGLSGQATQAELAAALADMGFVIGDLAVVRCDDDACSTDPAFGEEVFTGNSDLDGDGMTNRQEYDASGGDVTSFLNAATDNIPGVNGGCPASAGGLGPGRWLSVWDAVVLMGMIGLLVLRRRRLAVLGR